MLQINLSKMYQSTEPKTSLGVGGFLHHHHHTFIVNKLSKTQLNM